MANNTRLVVITPLDSDSLQLTLYYGRRKADKAKMTGVSTNTRESIVRTIEEFRLYGLGDGHGN